MSSAQQINSHLDMYPSEMWKLYRYESHIGKALDAALGKITSTDMKKSLRLSKEDVKTCVESFDKTLVKYLRTEAPEEPYLLEAEKLEGYRILPRCHIYIMRNVSVIRCVKPITVQWWVREQRMLLPGFGENVKNPKVPKKISQGEMNRRLKFMKNHYFKIKIAEVDELKIVCDNPFKGGQVKVAAVAKSREGIYTDEFGDRYSYDQLRGPTKLGGEFNPYQEYMYREKLPKTLSKAEQREILREEAERKRQEKIQNIPHRFKNSNSYKKFLKDSNMNDDSDESMSSTVKAPSAVSQRTISTATSSRPSYKTSYKSSPHAKGRKTVAGKSATGTKF